MSISLKRPELVRFLLGPAISLHRLFDGPVVNLISEEASWKPICITTSCFWLIVIQINVFLVEFGLGSLILLLFHRLRHLLVLILLLITL